MKRPEAGEYWQDNTGRRLYVIGHMLNGHLVYAIQAHSIALTDLCGLFSRCHHLPECTGWDWEPPDWVTQDRVPIRKGVDQYKINDWSEGWVTSTEDYKTLWHGKKGYEVRCLRKDLPPKTPQIGEWWFSPDRYGRCLIHGFASDGSTMFEYRQGKVDAMKPFNQLWHHEPNCTGWDWKP